MFISLRSIFCMFAFVLCLSAAKLAPQNLTPHEPQCFSIQLRLNGKPLDGPQVITLRSQQTETTASLEEGCFKVPPPAQGEGC